MEFFWAVALMQVILRGLLSIALCLTDRANALGELRPIRPISLISLRGGARGDRALEMRTAAVRQPLRRWTVGTLRRRTTRTVR